MDSHLKDVFDFVFNSGYSLKNGGCIKSNPLVQCVTRTFPASISQIILPYMESCKIIGCAGHGSWSRVMYVAILDNTENRDLNGFSVSKGIFPAFLISNSCHRIYLVYMLGVGTKSDREIMRMVKHLRSKINYTSFSDCTSELELGEYKEKYAKAVLFYKSYLAHQEYSNEELAADLNMLMDIHYKQGLPNYKKYNQRDSFD